MQTITFQQALRLLSYKLPNYCGGQGTIRVEPHWDSGHDPYSYPCEGCGGCRPDAGVGPAIARFFALAGLAPALTGFAALAAIGEAVAAAAAPAAGICNFIVGATAAWNEVRKGAWYQVTGKRGSAKAHHGVVGECVWVGEGGGRTFHYGRTYRTVGATDRVGLKAEGADKPVYVPASCVTRVPTPASAQAAQDAREAARAERAARKQHQAGKGDVVAVTHGASAGQVGRVFWIGSGKLGTRYGLDPQLDRKRGRCPNPLWVDAVDCGPATAPPIPVAEPAKFTPSVKIATPTTEPIPTACSGKHRDGDGSTWVRNAKGVPVARACANCRAAKEARYAS